MTKITYVGLERCDIVYHLATVLSQKDNVLVIDNSYGLDLIDAVSLDGTREMRQWHNIVYAADINIEETDVSDFEFVIVYAGESTKENDVSRDNYTLIMPDFTHRCLEAVRDLPEMAHPMYIFRDCVNRKFSSKRMATYLDVDKDQIIGAQNLITNDIAAYHNLTTNHYSNIKSLSEETNECLKVIVSQILRCSDRELNKYFKYARRIK